MKRYVRDDRGATAVEFALTLPLLCFVVTSVLQIGIGLQRWNALQAVSDATARCSALSAPACSTGDATTSYALQLSVRRGMSDVTKAMVTISSVNINGVAVKNVTIRYPLNVAGLTTTLSAVGNVPIP